jgi:DNA-binding CsgD family transcriptional regulator
MPSFESRCDALRSQGVTLTPYEERIWSQALEGLTQAEIGQVLHKSRSAIASAMHRTRVKVGGANEQQTLAMLKELGLIGEGKKKRR